MNGTRDFADTSRVDYARALGQTDVYLAEREPAATSRELSSLLAEWVAEGEALLYPLPALDPTRPQQGRGAG